MRPGGARAAGGLPNMRNSRAGLTTSANASPTSTSPTTGSAPRLSSYPRETRVVTWARVRVLLPRALACARTGGSNRLSQLYSCVLALARIRRFVVQIKAVGKEGLVCAAVVDAHY